jgi:hypothetical protein
MKEESMGASIYWRPVGKGKRLSVGLRSKFVSSLSLPRKLTAEDITYLHGLAAGEPDFKEAIDELVDAIYRHGEVEVYAEY